MDGTHKGRKRCTGRGERAMWTALFFPLGFDEVAHDPDNGKGYIETINNQTHLPATLSFLPSQQAHIDIPKSLRVEFYIKTRLATRCLKRPNIMDGIHKGRKRGEKELCGQHSFFHWVLMRFHMIRDGERVKDEPYASSPHQSPTILLKKLLASTFCSFASTSFRTAVTYLH